MQLKIYKITPRQINFIEALFTGYTNAQRNAFIETTINREIHYLDELTINEANKVIVRIQDKNRNLKLKFE
jgi:hypothetical protein